MFAKRLADDGFPVALEITPPRRMLPGVLRRRADILGDAASAVNVIQRSDRLTSLEASLALKAYGYEPVWHLASRGRSRTEILADIAQAAAGGVRHVLCLRGDHEAADVADAPKIRETVAMVRQHIPDGVAGATLNQYLEPARVLANLVPKIAAGATYVQTQPVFDVSRLALVVEQLRSKTPGIHVVPMVMPIVSAEGVKRIEERLGIRLPGDLAKRIEQGGEAAGWEAFDETLAALRESPLVDGAAVMTMSMDPDEEFCARLRTAVTRVS